MHVGDAPVGPDGVNVGAPVGAPRKFVPTKLALKTSV